MALNYEETLMLDANIKSKEKQITRLEEIKENTYTYSDDKEYAKKTIIKMIDLVIGKLEVMTESEYGKILFDVPFDFTEEEAY